MATVRIYKVAELLNTSSQEVMALLKQEHGIDVKSASGTTEEVVARQFAERVARQRGVTLPPPSAMFADSPSAARARKVASAKTVEPAKAKGAALPPPRLIKTKVPHPAEVAAAEAAAEAEALCPSLEAPPSWLEAEIQEAVPAPRLRGLPQHRQRQSGRPRHRR